MSLPKNVHKQQPRSHQTAKADHGVADPECQSVVGRLERRQESEDAKCGDGKEKHRPDNGDKQFHYFSPLLVAFSSRFLRHLSLQYFTSSHTFAHFLRHLKGRPQTTQIFPGRFGFLWGMEKPSEIMRYLFSTTSAT